VFFFFVQAYYNGTSEINDWLLHAIADLPSYVYFYNKKLQVEDFFAEGAFLNACNI
jgi:hypothetical protein